MTRIKISRYLFAALLALFLSSSCAKMFACTTDASYITRADGTAEVHYSSCKEQIGLDADIDPVTKRLHVKVDKSSTQDAVIAATLQMQLQFLKMLEAAQKGAALGAGVPLK